LGEKVKEFSIDFLLTLGEKARLTGESARRHGFDPKRTRVVKDHSEAISILTGMMREGDWILIKGSRGMTMEKIVEGLIKRRV